VVKVVAVKFFNGFGYAVWRWLVDGIGHRQLVAQHQALNRDKVTEGYDAVFIYCFERGIGLPNAIEAH
jgi:hypothetical protein